MSLLLTVIAAFVTLMPAAQTTTPQTASSPRPPLDMTGAVKAVYDMTKGYILKSADMMPEELYAFQPTPAVRTFGRLIGHIADDNTVFCGAVLGDKASFTIEKTLGTGSKADLKKALADSFAVCDRAFAIGAEKLMNETTSSIGGLQPKLGALAFNNAHIMEHYGNIVTYMRLKDMVPPSSGGK